SVSSKRAEFLDFAVKMLDTSRLMLSNLADKPALAQTMQVSSAGVPRPSIVGSPTRPTLQQRPSATQQQQLDEDQMMEDAPSLTRTTTAGSAFSGFSNDALDQYSPISVDKDSPISQQG